MQLRSGRIKNSSVNMSSENPTLDEPIDRIVARLDILENKIDNSTEGEASHTDRNKNDRIFQVAIMTIEKWVGLHNSLQK